MAVCNSDTAMEQRIADIWQQAIADKEACWAILERERKEHERRREEARIIAHGVIDLEVTSWQR